MPKTKDTFKSKITPQELEYALNRGGKTEVDIAKEYGVSRQRVHRVGKDWGMVRHKTAQWYANYYGLPELADKDWLEANLQRAGSARRLSRAIDISSNKIKAQAERLGIARTLLVYQAKRIKLRCYICGVEFERKASSVKGQHCFCSNRCKGKWIGSNFGRSHTSWSSEQDEFLKTYYQEMTDAQMAEELGKSLYTVKRRRRKFKLKKHAYPERVSNRV